MLAKTCIGKLRYTSATDYIAFVGDHWDEDKQKALGVIEDFMDRQLADAGEAVRIAEENLTAIGIPEEDVRARGKKLMNQVPVKQLGLLHALLGADAYRKFVMKYRNYRNIVNTQNCGLHDARH